MLLAVIALTVSIVLGAPGPLVFSQSASSGSSQLPATLPGLSRFEGVFLITLGDDGSPLVYFIAQNTRHSTLAADLRLEQQLNGLWPVWQVNRDEVLAFPEAAPVGGARSGLLAGPQLAEPAVDAEGSAVGETAAPDGDAASASTASEPSAYVLQPGDNLTRISARYSTTVEAILAANGMSDANKIYFGQTLLIPGADSAPGETLATRPPADQSPAPIVPVVAEEPTPAADVPGPVDSVTYTVKAGDSAIHIARVFAVDLDDLLAMNGVSNPNRVYVGQVLTIPGA